MCCPFHDDKDPSMKVDDRYYCFGCQATGDVIDFVSKVYGISVKEAASKLAADFGIKGDFGRSSPTTMYDNAQKTLKSMPGSQDEWLLEATDTLMAYERLLKDWRVWYAPKITDEDWHPLFVESLRNLDRISYLVDMALCGDSREADALFINYRKEIEEIGQRITEHHRTTELVPRRRARVVGLDR